MINALDIDKTGPYKHLYIIWIEWFESVLVWESESSNKDLPARAGEIIGDIVL